MAIDTTTKKLAMLHFQKVWEADLPFSPAALGQDDEQQLLWGYPGILWTVLTHVQPSTFPDLTTIFIPYVEALHDATLIQHDSDTLVAVDLATVRANEPSYLNDANTMYVAYISTYY